MRFYFPCPQCQGAVSSLDLVRHYRATDDFDYGVFQCIDNECQFETVAQLSDMHIARISLDHIDARIPFPTVEGDYNAEDETLEEEEDSRVLSRSEEIGRMVQGMRIELDTIGNVADLQALWTYQESAHPETVVREAQRA